MKLVLFERAGGAAAAGILMEGGVVPMNSLQPAGVDPQGVMRAVIDGFAELRGPLTALAAAGERLPLDSIRLLPPLPRPGKILN